MKLSATAQTLYDAFCEFEIIDAHEHLPPKKGRLATAADFSLLFSHYTRHDLFSAGMPEGVFHKRFRGPEVSLEEKWKLFAPFLPAIRHGCYARPAEIRPPLGWPSCGNATGTGACAP